MTIFDSDIYSDLVNEVPVVVARASAIPRDEQAITIVTVEEAVRGQLNTIRQAEAGRGKVSLPEAYEFLRDTLEDCGALRIVSYTDAAQTLYQVFKASKIRVGSRDLRIAATAIAHGARLATRNARDFGQIPGLDLEVWG
jgi:tRNA(fMet)-specific endonuclease VapC